jgi:hypothetical protein
MAVGDWSVPFLLTSTVYTNNPIPASVAPNPLPINSVVTFPGGDLVFYRLRPDACTLTNVVRQTKDYVPQADGAILHRRFTGGMEMQLTVQLWQSNDRIACDAILQEMIDTFNGYLYGLLNAPDNAGRISWTPVGQSVRMLDDIRLLSYPVESQSPGAPFEITCTIDTYYPYAENLTQLSPSIPGTVVNYGNRPTYPVWKVYGPYTGFTLANSTTGDTFTYDGTLPGAAGVGALSYMEIDTFRNTLYLNGSGANLKPGVVMVDSDFSPLLPGNNVIAITYTGGAGGASVGLINAAWI